MELTNKCMMRLFYQGLRFLNIDSILGRLIFTFYCFNNIGYAIITLMDTSNR